MHCCYAWNHRRQRWHTPSSVLLSFALPSPWRQKKEKRKNSSLYAAKTSSTSQAVLLLSFKHSWSLCNNFPPPPPTIAMMHSNATAFFIGALHSVRCSYDKRELHSKMHPAVCSYLFLLTYFFFTIKRSPDLITNLQRETRLSGAHVCLLRTGRSSFYSTAQVSYDLKRNVEIGQIYCSRFDWAFCKGKGRNVPSSLRRHLRRLWRGCKPFQDTKLPCYREDQMPRALQRWIVI